MAICIVHILESIQIHHDDREGIIISAGRLNFLFESFIQGAAVGQAGQRVAVCLSADHLMQAGV